MKSQEEREKIEIEFWRDSEHDRPESASIDNIVNKMGDCGVFLIVIEKYRPLFNEAKEILELGGGQGWASCALKSRFPHLKITLTDISEYAILSKHKWEKIMNVSLENAYPCKSYEIPEGDATQDIIFCYASAHHFADMDKTMREINRVLRKGGHCFFFHEPTTIQLFYKFAYKRVNKKRHVVPEDVIVRSKLLRLAEANGFNAEVHLNPITMNRGPIETIYYYVLSKIKILQRTLPCTANFHFQKL
ncbi:MAG: class I SAM-dependent methyltransferase [Bacteroidota bacterium]